MKHPFTIERNGRTYHLVKHPRDSALPDSEQKTRPWYVRVGFAGQRHPTLKKVGEASDLTVDEAGLPCPPDKSIAVNAARQLIRAARTGANPFLKLVDSTRYRRTGPSLGHIFTQYRAGATALLGHTAESNIAALRQVVLRALGENTDVESTPLTALDAGLVYRYKQATTLRAEREGADAQRRMQIYRSANSTLRQARSLFTPEMRSHYRWQGNLTLPENIEAFRTEPGFRDVAKEDYRIPNDKLIHATFEDLARQRELRPNLYLAVWLALGFGLRKSEMAAARADWFFTINGAPHIEIRSTAIHGEERPTTKNKQVCPRIRCTNDAWAHIKPFIEGLAPDAYVFQTATMTERCEGVFRDVASWMRGLGWETQKTIHEFRAFGGCQVAMRDGLLVAKEWMRHSSVVVTEKHYGRYIRVQVTDAALKFPELNPQFMPIVVPGAGA